MRRRYIFDDATGRLVEVSTDYVPRPRVHIIGDTIEPMRSMADGQIYTSKGSYYAEVKARGFEVVGNEKRAVMAREAPPADDFRELYQTASERGISL